ncbi:MAG TPA: DUF3710 domain-containing protein [Marmoricola sp.]|nr:DUF3710 domain-containing protein [Marmoricola sp.]
MRKRRKAAEQPDTTDQPAGAADGATPGPVTDVEGPRAHGPWDVSEHPVEEDDETRAHLGALSVAGHPEVELRLQVDEASGNVAAVMLVAKDGAMELRAFAAPRNEELWEEIRPKLAAEAARRGGTATPVDGPYGTALHMVVPGVTPDGQKVTQPQTVLGIAGPRWLLRVTAFGRPAQQYRPDGLLETVLRSVVVIRGNQPMAPGEALPLVLPARAQRMQPPG